MFKLSWNQDFISCAFFSPFCGIINNASSPKEGIKQSSALVSPEAAGVTPLLCREPGGQTWSKEIAWSAGIQPWIRQFAGASCR